MVNDIIAGDWTLRVDPHNEIGIERVSGVNHIVLKKGLHFQLLWTLWWSWVKFHRISGYLGLEWHLRLRECYARFFPDRPRFLSKNHKLKNKWTIQKRCYSLQSFISIFRSLIICSIQKIPLMSTHTLRVEGASSSPLCFLVYSIYWNDGWLVMFLQKNKSMKRVH